MTCKKEKQILVKLQKMKLSNDVILYILEAVRHCVDSKIHVLDISLEKDIYPHLIHKFDKTKGGIETKIVTELRYCWENVKTREETVSILKYENKPTFKKLLTLLVLAK